MPMRPLDASVTQEATDRHDGAEGADDRLSAALGLRQALERSLKDDLPCALFVRWKPITALPVGWTLDLNDGGRVNLRPFLSVELACGGRAGVLRWKPNVAWGKEPASLRPRGEYPCPGAGTVAERTDFLDGDEFDGNRWNDLHYTNAAKRAARTMASSEESEYAASSVES